MYRVVSAPLSSVWLSVQIAAAKPTEELSRTKLSFRSGHVPLTSEFTSWKLTWQMAAARTVDWRSGGEERMEEEVR